MINTLYSPKYTSVEQVRLDLKSKVKFGNINTDAVSDNQVLDVIKKAEANIELKLSRQYITPFAGVDINGLLIPYENITNEATINYINKLCTLKTCILMLETYFGRSEGVRGSSYYEQYQKELKEELDSINEKDPKTGQWLNPPLPGLAVNKLASFFQPGVAMPMVARIGATSCSYGNQVLARQINGVRNWWYGRGGGWWY